MEEKLAVLPQTWTGFLIEFPTLPRQLVDGKEASQRVLFLCPATEKNPTELCLALFGRQIVMQRMPVNEPLDAGAPLRVAFLYAPSLPHDPGQLLAAHGDLEETVIMLASKANAVRSARTVLELLSQPGALNPRVALESGPSLLGSGATQIDGEEVIWDEPLPEIVMVDSEGNLIRAATKLNDYRAEYACRYVLAHFHENVNRDRMAEMVHLSPGYFSNLFRSEVGTSFSDYLIMVRIENAKAMLRRFELSVEAISKKCGFNSLAHFSRTFKDRCGLSPLKYRKSPHVAP
jgi:AraC-like DNA-binding protein